MNKVLEVKYVHVNELGNYLLLLSNDELLYTKSLDGLGYELQNVKSVEFEPNLLIEQCCSVREEIMYSYLTSPSRFGAAQLGVLLRDSKVTIEQAEANNNFDIKIKNIQIITPRLLDRYDKIREDYLDIITLLPQDSEGVELYEIATKYHHGKGIEKNINEAIRIYIKAAEKGNAEAQLELHSIFIDDYYVPKDINKANSWLKKAAEQGLSYAREVLAECYLNGDDGVERDTEKAIELFTYAAIQGNVGAQFHLGRIFQYGIGLESNLKNAVKWYEIAQKENKYADVQYELGTCYEQGDDTNGLKKDICKAIKCYEFAAKYNNANALFALGMCYEFGKGVSKDVIIAIDYYTKSIENGGDILVWATLGSLYYRYDAIRDYEKAVYYLTCAAQENMPHSQTELAYCYYYGYNDKLQAFDWFLKAANNGDMMASQALNTLEFK